MTPTDDADPRPRAWATWDTDVLVAAQLLGRWRPARRAALALSAVGEHAAGWLAVAALGAALDPPRRAGWARAGAAVLGAHAASVVLKRVLRRHRPTDPRVRVLAGTPSRWSLPSSHASSTTAAAVAFAGVLGSPAPLALAPAMAAARLVLGVHYPSDVLVGAALGAAIGRRARTGRR